ncbi:MAG: hypothetical protein JRN59_08100 [Nitrososphaerota archaeon]|jgi:metal-responsive CopG/Arc/MetJ family transcriptional regulator|nr:hypothetical protein [Nitrososphaerota archaeon]MDG6921476.1 hypothetical protein [Nitrososphaerota archaeon]
MPTRRVRAGISFDDRMVDALDAHAKKLESLQVDRSEIVNAILDDFFEGNGTTESVWGVVSKRRIRKRI